MKINPLMMNNHTSFKAGKTTLYSDFDGTYYPYTHGEMCCSDEFVRNQDKINTFNGMYDKFKTLFKNDRDKMEFVLTTGRNLAEYRYIEKRIDEKKLNYMKPNVLLTRDGSDKFYRQDTGWVRDEYRDLNIRNHANAFERHKIESDLKNIIKNEVPGIYLTSAPINKHRLDYGDKSLEHVLNSTDSKEKKTYASFESGDDLHISIAFSNKVDLHELSRKFREYFALHDMKMNVASQMRNPYIVLPQYYNETQYNLEPANMITIKPMSDGEIISKLYDVKEKVRNNINGKTDDLVITAGDGINDEPMLNILNYLDLYGVNVDKSKSYDEILQDADALNALRKLPLAVIIAGDDRNLDTLRELGKKLDDKGIYKIICVKSPQHDFVKHIMLAVKNYGDQNENYKTALGENLYNKIYGRVTT